MRSSNQQFDQNIVNSLQICDRLRSRLIRRSKNVRARFHDAHAVTSLSREHRKEESLDINAEVPMIGWLAVLAAGLFEIGWAFGLKYSDGLTRFWPTVATALAILASFSLMAFALKSLPFGTAYAIWTGIGAAGSIIVGMVIFSEPTDPVRIICLTLIVAGMVGLKLTSPV
jgi:quaternary ammonium compound-resistance protein SugE